MSKKAVNQNVKYVQELIDIIEPDFNFNSEPINRFKTADDKDNNNNQEKNKSKQHKN